MVAILVTPYVPLYAADFHIVLLSTQHKPQTLKVKSLFLRFLDPTHQQLNHGPTIFENMPPSLHILCKRQTTEATPCCR